MSIHINSQKDFTTLFKENSVVQQFVAKGFTKLHVHCDLKLNKNYDMAYWIVDKNITLHLNSISNGKFYTNCNYIIESCEYCSFNNGKFLDVRGSNYCYFNTKYTIDSIDDCAFCQFVVNGVSCYYIKNIIAHDIYMCKFVLNDTMLLTIKPFAENAEYCALIHSGKKHGIASVFSDSKHCEVIKSTDNSIYNQPRNGIDVLMTQYM